MKNASRKYILQNATEIIFYLRKNVTSCGWQKA